MRRPTESRKVVHSKTETLTQHSTQGALTFVRKDVTRAGGKQGKSRGFFGIRALVADANILYCGKGTHLRRLLGSLNHT